MIYIKCNECVPLLPELRLWGRKCGAGVCAQRETNSQRPEEERKRKDKSWARPEKKHISLNDAL